MSEDAVQVESKGDSPRRWREIVFAWATLLLVANGLATLMGFGARLNGYLELAVHYKLVYFSLALVLVLAYGVIGRWRYVGISLLLVCVHGPGILSWYVPQAGASANGEAMEVTLLIANVQALNTDFEVMTDYIRERDADVMVIQELSYEWKGELEILAEELYPYSLFEPRFDNFGMATLSKYPVERLEVFRPEGGGAPKMEMELIIGGRMVSLLNFHPVSPITSTYMALRNEELKYIAEFAKNAEGLVIVAGDLNITPWSPYYRDMIDASGLYNARQGFGVLPTWPSVGPLFPMIPIDHCLLSPEIVVSHIEVGPRLGADHQSLWVVLGIPAE